LAYQLSNIVSKVQQRVRDTGYSSSEITNYINDAQNDVFNEYRLPFMETTQTYTLTADVSDITNGSGLPANYVQAIDLILTTTGREKVLPWIDIRELERMYPDPTDTTVHPSNVPIYWYYYADTIRVFPSPNEAYTATLRYYKKPTVLENDADVPEVPSQFEELLVSGASYRVLQVKDNYDQASIHENKYMELLQKLVVRYSQPQVGTPTRMRVNRSGLGKTSF
jgi:hypothetical protein